MDGATVVNAAKLGHSAGWQQAKKCLPALDVNEIIKIITPVFEAKDHQGDAAINAAKALALKYKKPIEVYLNAFSVVFIENGLKQIKFENISSLGNKQFAKQLVDAAKNVENVIVRYCHSEIDEVELISRLCKSGILDVGQAFIQAAGINLAEVKDQIHTALGDVKGASVLLISFYASAAAYKMLNEALQEAAEMREERIRIEEECNQSIELMRQYRMQMSASVSDYLFIRSETFNEGVAAMDQAIMDGDINGFIRGNTIIQEILNYKIQFRNQDEFDMLMESDTAFVL